MEYIAKVTLYHNTKGLIKEGQAVEFTKDEVAEYDKDYFNSLFEPVGDASAEVEEVEETDEVEEAEATPKKRGKKAEETAE